MMQGFFELAILWVTLLNPEPLVRQNGRVFYFGDRCILADGWNATPLMGHEVWKVIEERAGRQTGDNCPNGALFFMTEKEWEVLKWNMKVKSDVEQLLKKQEEQSK